MKNDVTQSEQKRVKTKKKHKLVAIIYQKANIMALCGTIQLGLVVFVYSRYIKIKSTLCSMHTKTSFESQTEDLIFILEQSPEHFV